MPVATPVVQILFTPVGRTVYGDGGYMPLIVAERSGEGLESRVIVTTDGRPVLKQWHSGPEDADEGESVFFEEYTKAGRVCHGWVSVVSRKLVQVG